MKPLRHAERVVPADGDERVDAPASDALEHGAARRVVLAGIGAGGAEDRPAVAQDPVRVPHPEDARLALAQETGPAIRDAEDLVTERGRAQNDRADRRVEPGGVAAAGENPDPQG